MADFETASDLSARRNRRLQIALEQKLADLKVLMSTPHGQRFFGAFLDEDCGVLCGTYNAQAPDPGGNALYEEGRRGVGLDLIGLMQSAAPAEYAALMYERMKLSNEELLRAKRESVPKPGES